MALMLIDEEELSKDKTDRMNIWVHMRSNENIRIKRESKELMVYISIA